MHNARTGSFKRWLGTNPPHLACVDALKRGEDCWNERPEVKHPIRGGAHEQDAERLLGERLLKLQLAIHCDESIKAVSGAAEQLAVLDSLPTQSYDGLNLVARELGSQINRDVLVK